MSTPVFTLYYMVEGAKTESQQRLDVDEWAALHRFRAVSRADNVLYAYLLRDGELTTYEYQRDQRTEILSGMVFKPRYRPPVPD